MAYLPLLKRFSIVAPVASAAIYFLKENLVVQSGQNPVLHALEKDLQLQNVQVVFRHGARTPTVNLPYVKDLKNVKDVTWDAKSLLKTLPKVDIDIQLKFHDGTLVNIDDSPVEKHYSKHGELKGGCLTGQLTTIGQDGMYDVGRWLRREYVNKHGLIAQEFNPDELYIRTSLIKRTVLSVKCLLCGLFGKENIKEPVVALTNKIEREDIFPNWGGCHRLKYWVKDVWFNFDIFPEHLEEHEELNRYLGADPDEPLHFVAILDFIHCRKVHGLEVPEYLLKNEKQIEKRASELQAMIIAGKDNEQLGAAIGSLLNTLCSRMEHDDKKKNMYLYSAHDTTIMSLLIAFGLYDYSWPSFSSNIVLELYKDKNDKKYVRVLYNGDAVILDKENDNNEYKTLESFQNLIEKYRAYDWDKVCGN